MASVSHIAFLPPCAVLNDYVLMSQPEDQPCTIPATFKDAMKVRNEVFGKEQGIPMEYEWDEDDARSSHWVIYSTTDINDQNRVPIATIRAVPFPHPPHPENGSRHFELGENTAPPPPPSKEPPPYIIDRATTFHNGREPYIKLGRISVLKEHRGKGFAKVLVMTALQWLREHPAYFNPTPETARLNALETEDTWVWKGLICAHAQQSVAPGWAKWGFELDEGMGTWYEASIPHVGMFQRLKVQI